MNIENNTKKEKVYAAAQSSSCLTETLGLNVEFSTGETAGSGRLPMWRGVSREKKQDDTLPTKKSESNCLTFYAHTQKGGEEKC